MPFTAQSAGKLSLSPEPTASHRPSAGSLDDLPSPPSVLPGLPSSSGSSLPPSPPLANRQPSSLLLSAVQQSRDLPALPPPSSASSVRSMANRRPSASTPPVCDPAAAQSSTRRPPAVGGDGLLSPLAGHVYHPRAPSPSRSVSSPAPSVRQAHGSGGTGLAAALGSVLKPKAKWARGLTRRGSSSAMSVLGGSSPTTLAGASASTPTLLLTGTARAESGGSGGPSDAQYATPASPLRPTTTFGSTDGSRSSTSPFINTASSPSPFGRPPPRSAPPGSTSSPSTFAARKPSATSTREPPLERKPSRLFFSLRKSTAPRRPSAASIFGGSPGGPASTSSTAAVDREMDVGSPFNCQHDLHVGMEDLTALPAEWIAQLRAQGLSTEQLLKLAQDKSRSIVEREKVAPRPIAQPASVELRPTASADVGSSSSVASHDSTGTPSTLPIDRVESAHSQTPPSLLSPASKPFLADAENKAERQPIAFAPERASAPPLLAPLLPPSTASSEPADSWAQGLLGAFSTTTDGSLGKAGAGTRRSLPPIARRVSGSAPPLGSDGAGGTHGHSQSLSFLSTCKTFDAEGSAASLTAPLQWRPQSAQPTTGLGLGAPPTQSSLGYEQRSTSRASSTRPRESSSDHGHSAVDGPGGQGGVAGEDDRPPRRRQRHARESVESFATAASELDCRSPRDSHAMDGLEEFGVPPAPALTAGAPLPPNTFGQAGRPAWLGGRSHDADDDGSEESGPLPDLLSSVSSTGHHHYRTSTTSAAATTATDSRLSVASRFTATSRVTSLSPSTFSSSDFHSHEGQLVEDAVISRAVHLSSRPVGDWAHHDGKAMRLTVFAPAFSWPADGPADDSRSPSSPATEGQSPGASPSGGVLFSPISTVASSLADTTDDARDGVDALDQAVRMFRARSLDNLRALTRNTSLLSPFLLDYPSSLSHTLDDSASCIAFNPTGYFAGSFVAVGRTDGCISIWDVLTHDVVWVETGHAKQVESVSWSRNSRFLLSASRDGTAIVWDLERSARLETVRFGSPVINAQFHPGNARIFVATLATGQVVVVDLRPSSRGQRQIIDPGLAAAATDEPNQGKGKQRATDGGAAPTSLTFARFNPSGRRLYVGTKKGELLILDSCSHEILDRIKISNSAVKELAFSLQGQYVVVNSHDRAVRVLSISHGDDGDELAIAPLHRFQDLVNRTPWNGVGCSGNGEYAMAGSGSKISHDVYIWNLNDGSLTKMLDGPKEALIGVDWHPTKPVIASVSGLGSVHLWEEKQTDTWSAFAPGFEELEENATYVEREDEFDEEDASEALRRKELAEDAPIDILTTTPPKTALALPPMAEASSAPKSGWWWETEGDGDDKTDWYLPIKLGKDGRVWRDWESLFE